MNDVEVLVVGIKVVDEVFNRNGDNKVLVVEDLNN